MKQKTLKRIIIYTAVSLFSAFLLALSLVLSAMIPRSMLNENMRASADILCERVVFFELWNGIPASKIDRYADSILLNIAYNQDSDDPLRSVMLSEYYYLDYQNENNNFSDSVKYDHPGNTQYLRYWHGSAIAVRLMHLFTDIRGMYITNAVVMAILTALLMFLLLRHRLYAGAVGTVVSLAMVAVWFVPYSLEYTHTFIVMLIMSVAAVKLSLSEKWDVLCCLFPVCGILTAFLDFLTTETLTLLFPLLLSLYIRREKETRENVIFAVKNTVLWGVGFVGMWAAKWITAGIVLGEDVAPYISEHIAERINGDNYTSAQAIWNNFTCIFPGGLGGIGIAAAIVIVFLAVYVCFVYRKDGINVKLILIYTAAGVVPYVRYTVLMNHSALHCFFTYRAQAATILAVCLIIYEIVGGQADDTKKRKHA